MSHLTRGLLSMMGAVLLAGLAVPSLHAVEPSAERTRPETRRLLPPTTGLGKRRLARPAVELTQSEVETIVLPALKPGTGLAFAPYRGDFGPTEKSILALVHDRRAKPARFAGFVLAPMGATNKRYELPPLHSSGEPSRINDVIFADLNQDTTLEIIVLASYRSERKASKKFQQNAVFRMQGTRFERWDAMEQRISKLEDAVAVRQALGIDTVERASSNVATQKR